MNLKRFLASVGQPPGRVDYYVGQSSDQPDVHRHMHKETCACQSIDRSIDESSSTFCLCMSVDC